MSTWHGYADGPALASGAQLLITGGHERIRLATGDQVSIETPDNNRRSGVIVDRTAGRMLVAVGDGPAIHLNLGGGTGAFEHFKLSDGFSRECWTVQ